MIRPEASVARGPGRSLRAVPVALALTLLPAFAFAQPPAFPIYWYKFDSPFLYAAMGAHGDVSADYTWSRATVGIPFDGLPADVNWSHTLSVVQTENGPGDDAVTIGGTVGHVMAPHGEPPNASTFTYGWEVDAGDFPLGAGPGGISGYQWIRERRAQFAHGLHGNKYWAGLGVWVWDGSSSGHDLLAYQWMVMGQHTSSTADQAFMGGGPLYGQPVGGGGGISNAGGQVAVICDNATSSGLIGIQTGGIERSQYVAAHLHYGPQGNPQVLDLGPIEQWVDLSSPSDWPMLGRIIQGPVPAALLQSLAAGEGYVDVHTQASLAGEIKGALAVYLVDAPLPEATAGRLALRLGANPSRGPLSIHLALPKSGWGRVTIHDLAGAAVRILREGVMGPGAEDLLWDGRDSRGQRVAAGVYFVRAEAGRQVATARAVRID